MTHVDRDFLASQIERILAELHSMREEMGGMRDEIRALSALMLRLDSSAKAMTQEMHAISGLLGIA
jgi:Ni,Fe-hydrogenase III large subunit